MITKLKGELEIHHERGVVYFHLTNASDVKTLGQMTPLRVCGIARPIPDLKAGRQIDVHVDKTDYTEQLEPDEIGARETGTRETGVYEVGAREEF